MDVAETVARVKANMLGRIADERNNTEFMAEVTLMNGNHLEIGTLHGGSAIVVALLKKHYGYSGRVTCIDPLNGYYADIPKWAHETDVVTNVPVTLETIRENEQRFGVSLEIIQAKSNPFPVRGRSFATAYIDGDHWREAPLIDFINASTVTSDYIVFDNCDQKHPDVMRACWIAEQVWTPYKRQGTTCIVRHP